MGLRTYCPKIWHFGILNTVNWRSLRIRQKQEAHSDLFLSPFFPETDHKMPIWKVCFLYWKERRHSYHQRWGVWGPRICKNKPCSTNLIFLVTSLPFTILSSNHFVLSILHKFIVPLAKKYKSFLIWSVLWVFSPLWRFPRTHKNSLLCAYFPPINISLSV